MSLSPTHKGDVLGTRFVITDTAAFQAAIHNLENRKRKADGRPSLEEEAAKAKAAADKAKAAADAKAKAAAGSELKTVQ